MADKKVISSKKEIDINSVTICDATAQMLIKARKDGVETAFDRAASMKACPIGADSACCKHCAMGPCRLNAKDPYSKVGSAARPSTRLWREILHAWSPPVGRSHRPWYGHA